MPCIAMFYGILVYMYHLDNKEHKLPHIHVEYQDFKAVFSIESGEMIAGDLSNRQRRLIEAWIELRREELLADWHLAVTGQDLFKIDPLR